MTKKTPTLELLKWLFWTTLAAYGLGYIAVLTSSYIFIDLPNSFYSCVPFGLVMVTFLIFYYRQIGRLDNLLPLKEKKGLKDTNARSITVNGTKQIFLSQLPAIFQPDAPQAPTSVLWWRYGQHLIKEDYAHEWLRKGWNRQLKGEPHPYSGNWMTKQRFVTLGNSTIERQYHDATCLLISDYQLWRKEPVQGASGKVLASPAACIAKLRGKW